MPRRTTPKLERRHFEFIAQAIRELPSDPHLDYVRSDIAAAFGDRLRATNPAFNRRRFVEACFPSEEH